METRARYVVIGAFVVAIIAASFAFVYWIRNTGGLGERTAYEVHFNEPVSGLVRGSSVLFNGIRVGEVTELRLDPSQPRRVIVAVALDPTAPVRADTEVGVDFAGLTGVPAITLKGGTLEAPPLKPINGHPPVLVAPPGVGQSLTGSARETLRNIDKLVAENSKPISNAIAGISTFADMLGRNSKKIEGVIEGLENLTGGGKPKQGPQVYDLTAPTAFPPIAKEPQGQLVVADLAAVLVFDTQKILVRSPAGQYTDVKNAQWADNLPKLIQAKVVQSFENAKQLKAVGRPSDDLSADRRLTIEIRGFQLSSAPEPKATVEFAARLIDKDGKVIEARIFSNVVTAKTMEPADAVAALNDAFVKCATDLVAWTVEKI